MLVPQDVRELLGISVFTQSLATDDPHLAAVKAKAIISGWKARVAEARRGTVSAWGGATELRRLAEAYREAHRQQVAGEDDGRLGPGVDQARDDIIEHVLKHHEPEGFDARQVAYERHDGDVYEALRLHPRGQEAVEMLDRLTETRTTLESLITAWEPHLHRTMKSRQAAMYRSDGRQFCEATGAGVETLDRRAVQVWVDKEIDAGRVTVKTLRRKLSSLRNLWKFAQKEGQADPERHPFRDLTLPREAVKRGVKREHFDAADIVSLWAQAAGDGPLQALIILAAYTGARIEELCLLRREHVDLEAAVMTIPGTKTNAAARKVPVL